MMRALVTLVLALYTQNIFPKFVPIDHLPPTWELVAQYSKRSVIKYDVPGSGRCTGTIISNSGHVLTAMHCFQDCLKSNGSFSVSKISNDSGFDYYARIKQEKLPTCNIRYKDYNFKEGDDLNSDLELTQAKIVATGAGKILLNPTDPEIDSIFDFHKRNTSLFSKLREKGIGRLIGDFVIFQSNAFKSKSCSKVSNERLKDNQLLSISFPNYTYSRNEGVNPNGRSQYMSLGSISRNGVLSSDSSFLNILKSNFKSNEIEKAYNFKNEIIWSDVDLVSGSSGSPLINKSGEIYALSTFNICDAYRAKREGCRYSSGGITISSIKKNISEDFFNCDR